MYIFRKIKELMQERKRKKIDEVLDLVKNSVELLKEHDLEACDIYVRKKIFNDEEFQTQIKALIGSKYFEGIEIVLDYDRCVIALTANNEDKE